MDFGLFYCLLSLSPAQLFHDPIVCNSIVLCPWDFPGKNGGVCCISFSKGSSWPGIVPASPALAGKFFTVWATREAPSF